MACMHTQDNCTLYVIASKKDHKAVKNCQDKKHASNYEE